MGLLHSFLTTISKAIASCFVLTTDGDLVANSHENRKSECFGLIRISCTSPCISSLTVSFQAFSSQRCKDLVNFALDTRYVINLFTFPQECQEDFLNLIAFSTDLYL